MKLQHLFEARDPSTMTKAAIDKEMCALEDKYPDGETTMPQKDRDRHAALVKAYHEVDDRPGKPAKPIPPEKRVTARKYMGDDAGSWAVFVDGRVRVTGLTKSEVAGYKTRFIKELTK